MLISTKGRYALRVMIDLAENQGGDFIPLKVIAHRQEISEKYLESIIKLLVKAQLVSGIRGKGGGYRLTRLADQYTVKEVLSLTEDFLAPVPCLKSQSQGCPRAASCRTLPLWNGLNETIDQYLNGVTIADLMEQGEDRNGSTI